MYRYRGLGKVNAAGAAGGAASGATAGMALGPIGAVVGGVIGGAAGAFSPSGESKGPSSMEVAAALKAAAHKARVAEAEGRLASAGTERGKVIKYALLGTGGLLLAGALTLWILSRKKNPRRSRRR